MLVSDVMTRDPIVAEVPGNRQDVLRLLVKHSVSGLPVVHVKSRELAGVVTRSDVFAKPDEEQLALIMTSRPRTIGPDAKVAEAARLFFEHRIHGLPVVEGGKLLGVVSPADLLRVMATTNGQTVDAFITNRVVPIYQETPLTVAWEVMRLTHNNALPVMDDRARLVGIVADSDLFKLSDVEQRIDKHELGLEHDEADEARIRDIAPLYYARSVLDLPRRPVKDIMVTKVITAFPKTSAEEAAQRMAKARINQLPVVDANEKLVGLITDLDLMRAWTP